MHKYLRKINKYYSSTIDDYKEFWLGKRDWAMHLGYSDNDNTTHSQSLIQMNEVLAGLVRISPNDCVLDAGCGYGGSAIWLAANVGCQVDGVNVVSDQLKVACELTRKRRLSRKVRFSYQDYCATSFSDASFDVLWALESVIHTKKKEAFFVEAARILKKGGRFLMADFFLTDNGNITKQDKIQLRKMEEGWAVTDLLTSRICRDLLSKNGFINTQVFDLTENVRLSMKRLGDICRIALPEAKIKLATGVWNSTRYKNVIASICADEMFDSKLLKYIAVTASKP